MRKQESESPEGGGGGFRLHWVFYGLVAALIVIGMLRAQTGEIAAWKECKESLFQQMFSDTCTPRPSRQPRVITFEGDGKDI